MYTCICNAIRETDLRAAAVKSKGCAETVYATLGKKPNCGQCLEKAQKTIEEERALIASLDPRRKLCEEVAL
ncbi:MAG: ferredoxin [Erythrobacter sp.]|uniref:(2Fe-2S)-binding protein n=1 Tax=Erythrobacter sp. TaxID=1042 RepID=UPI0032646530